MGMATEIYKMLAAKLGQKDSLLGIWWQ